MSLTNRFEVVLLLIAACVVLTVLARRLKLPQAGTLIVGGLALAVTLGMPAVEFDPDFVLVLFLPPLLLLSACMTDWRAAGPTSGSSRSWRSARSHLRRRNPCPPLVSPC